ncbi:MAG TPA: SDR family NAD(P)-dependent oxidoreductase [Porticoccaceae bacterium]
MTELRFDGRVAVITGAGRGLGRAYAQLLAERGARVVVNDIGASITGDGMDGSPAEGLVNAIKGAGGEAVASTDSVTTPEGGKAIIETALDHFGRLDILIHNAGNVRYGSLEEISYEDFKAVVDVHMMGAFNVVRPVFPIMARAGYGRVVLTGSIGGLYGTQRVVNYGMSKASMIGLNNVIALEGAEKGIKSNIILPGAVTRMAEGVDTSFYPPMGPELVAPVVGWLAHETCSITGEMLISIAGRVARAFIGETEGVFRPAWTMENVGEHLDAILDMERQWHLSQTPSAYMEHIVRSCDMAKQHTSDN